MLTLTLDKPGAAPARKLQLSLNKGAAFKVTVAWQCDARHQDDIDIHALEARNGGNGAKVAALEEILSTYNTTKMSPKTGVLPTAADGSFATPISAALRRSTSTSWRASKEFRLQLVSELAKRAVRQATQNAGGELDV